MKKEPEITIGIYSRLRIEFFLGGTFADDNGKHYPPGNYAAVIAKGSIQITGGEDIHTVSPSYTLKPVENSFFELKQVTIGVNFHWEQNEDQRFRGTLKLIQEDDKILAINIIGIEEYLKSVISSEMSATSSPELLKAHAVISRSWLLAQIEKNRKLTVRSENYKTSFESEEEIIRWYDREDHHNFDVCADDHCQRYQGITKIFSDKALKAVEDTFGEVLTFNDEICDARFSKCCGGISEDFRNAWEPVDHPYLTKIRDSKNGFDSETTDLTIEKNAVKWILGAPEAFCNTADKQILTQVLPGFDQATTDFFRWKTEYTQEELSSLIHHRSGIDFGKILRLEPLERGDSGRLTKLKIHGSKKTLIVGKELEIRKWLSKSHLYSSAFVVDYADFQEDIPQKFILTGAGWGHGVGLCQIGAAVMGEKGYSYSQILKHYFKGAEIEKLYVKS